MVRWILGQFGPASRRPHAEEVEVRPSLFQPGDVAALGQFCVERERHGPSIISLPTLTNPCASAFSPGRILASRLSEGSKLVLAHRQHKNSTPVTIQETPLALAERATLTNATGRRDGVGTILCRRFLSVGAIMKALHDVNFVGSLGVVTALHGGGVVQYHDAVEVHVVQRLHDLVHVVIAVIHKGFDEVRQRCAHVAEMNLPDLPGAEIADHLLGVFLSQGFAALQPGPAAQADPHVRAAGNLQRALVAPEVAEDATRHARQHRHRRVVGVDADAYTVLLRHRRHLFDEVGEVLPDLFIAELAPVRQRLRPRFPIPHSGLIGAGHVELPRRGAAYHGATARPDAVAHVRIGRIVDTGLAEVANILLVLLDLPVPPGQIERHFRHVVHAGVADVPYRNSSLGIPLLNGLETLGRAHIRRRSNAHIFGTDLFQKQQLLIGWSGARLGAQLDSGRIRMHSGPGFLRRESCPERATQHHLAEISAAWLKRLLAAHSHLNEYGVPIEPTTGRVGEAVRLPNILPSTNLATVSTSDDEVEIETRDRSTRCRCPCAHRSYSRYRPCRGCEYIACTPRSSGPARAD